MIDGRCSVGSRLAACDSGTLTNERLPGVTFLMVAARDHPLASHKGKIPKEVLSKHTQIVLTDRSNLSEGRELGVMSPATWRLGDLFAKHHFILGGLGWGGMPLHAVRRDLEEGRLKPLDIEDVPPGGLDVSMSAVGKRNHLPDPPAGGSSSGSRKFRYPTGCPSRAPRRRGSVGHSVDYADRDPAGLPVTILSDEPMDPIEIIRLIQPGDMP